ncbi:Ig-like domain-containing protein, partial [Rhodococcus sp. NPDC127527]|uniref:Ig-like domain-containing protein n=1 Tax=Rhodococcus sp. NPDC127527 TaxID=3345394 RepID=UPI0036394907
APSGGTVQFKDGGTNLGGPVNVTNGVATLSQSFATAGAKSVTAVFSGAAGFLGSTSAASNVAVSDPAPVDVATQTSVTVPATATTGVAVDLKATVSPANASGTVQFKDGGANIGGPVNVVNGVATLSHAFGEAGPKGVTAVFSGAAGFSGSTSAVANISVSDPAPVDVATSVVAAAPGSVKVGVAVDLSATVSPANASGTVQFKDGATNLGGPVNVVNGVATLSHAFDAAGAKSVTAVFSGAAGFLGSTSAPVSVSVSDPLPTDVVTSTVLTVPGSATAGQAVELKAVVTPATAGGTVQFKDGDTAIGAPVAVVDGKATLSHVFAAAGSRNITAVYSGAAGFTGSTSAKSVVVVAAAPGDGGGTGSLGSLFGS